MRLSRRKSSLRRFFDGRASLNAENVNDYLNRFRSDDYLNRFRKR